MPSPASQSAARAHEPVRVELGRWPRYLNAAIGAWLFLSAFVLAHSSASRANTAAVGVLIAASALLALRSWAVRIMNTVFAVWLAAFTLSLAEEALPQGGVMTSWHDLVVAAVVFALSLVPNPEEPRAVVRR
jgi:hypothetical protein